MAKKLYRSRAFYAVPDIETAGPVVLKAEPEKQVQETDDIYTISNAQKDTSDIFCTICEEKHVEPEAPIADDSITDISIINVAVADDCIGKQGVCISHTPAEIAAVHVSASNGEAVLICAYIHWKAASTLSSSAVTELLFKVWRGSPEAGAFIFSVKDNFAAATENKTTAFIHVDTGFDPSKETIYTLTVETSDTINKPQLIGSPIFTAVAMVKTYCLMP